jgi:hypothetical protein
MIAPKWIFLTIGILSLAVGAYKGSGGAFLYGVILLLVGIVEARSKDGTNRGGFGI